MIVPPSDAPERSVNAIVLGVVIAVAGVRTLSGDLREAYLDAADHLSGYEQGQVLTALVKSERRK